VEDSGRRRGKWRKDQEMMLVIWHQHGGTAQLGESMTLNVPNQYGLKELTKI